MGDFKVNIVGLSNKIHRFEYHLTDEFFKVFKSEIIDQGDFEVMVNLNKHETFIEATFKISGKTRLVCDRSLEPFDFRIEDEKKIVFKYGDEDKELSDEIVLIHRDTDQLDLGQYMYEFINLSIPYKKLHPKFADEADEGGGTIVFTSEADETPNEEDPRWAALKKLKQ
jgi:uncharacterized metal-binding protein YceD (DUF177 family)